MFRTSFTQMLIAGVLLSLSAEARSETAAEQNDQLTAPAGKLVINGFLEANLSKDAAFKPVSISPDVWYGATDELTVGLVHSSVATTGFLGGVGDSLCLSGKSDGCRHVYGNVGADVRYRLTAPFFVEGGLFIKNTSDPFQLALKVGAGGRWRFDKLSLEVMPSVFIGFNKRSEGVGNKDWFMLPATVAYQVLEKLELALQTGVAFQWEDMGDNYSVPLALAARYQVNRELGLGLAFALPRLVAPKTTPATPRGFDARTLMIGGSYAF